LRSIETGEAAPICLASLSRDIDPAAQSIASGFDDCVAAPLYDAKLVAHLRPLLRLVTMRTELRIRASAAEKAGAAPPRPPATTGAEPIKALVVGDIGATHGAFDELDTRHIDDFGLAVDTLHGQRFDIAVLVPGGDPASYLDLCQRIRSSPSLFNLPVAVVGPFDARIEEASFNSGASGFYDNSAGPEVMAVLAQGMVRRQRTRLHLGRALSATLTDKTRGIARAYSAAFFAQYMPARFDYAQTFGRHLAMLHVSSPDVAAVREKYGEVQAQDMERALEQWIAQLTRVEDLLATNGGAEFFMVLPDTPSAEAAAVASRIAAVVGQVEFALTEVYEGVRAHVAVKGAVLKPGESLAEFQNRAKRDSI